MESNGKYEIIYILLATVCSQSLSWFFNRKEFDSSDGLRITIPNSWKKVKKKNSWFLASPFLSIPCFELSPYTFPCLF